MSEINNDIKEQYCSFEISKMLKYIGFDVFCDGNYTEYKQTTEWNKKGISFEVGGILRGRNSLGNNNEYYEIVSAPTIAIATQWIRANYGIHIFVDYYNEGKFFGAFINKFGTKKELFNTHDSVEQAAEDVIKVVINLIIKNDSKESN